MTDELKPCPFCGCPPSVSYPLEDARQSLYRCVNIECPIYDVRCKPDEWDRRADTPEPADGMVMVEVLEGGGIWARQMRRDGRLVQCRYNDSHEWYSVTHLHEWDAAEYRLKPAEGVNQ